MSARDLARQIAEVRKRRGDRSLGWLAFDFDSLLHSWPAGEQSRQAADGLVIRAVTFLEVFTREWVASLVDRGSPYIERASELTRSTGLRLDYALVRAVQGRAVTLGELVSHSVAVNRLDQIVSYFEMLLDGGFARGLAATIDRWAVEIEQQPAVPIIPDYEKMCRDLSRLFEIRHVLCHELPARPVYEVAEVPILLASGKDFITAGTEFLQATVHGRFPLTTADMYEEAGRKLQEAEAELQAALQEMLCRASGDPIRLELLKLAAESWSAYRKAECELAADEFRGGNHAGLLWLAEATALTGERVKRLRARLEPE